MRGAVGELKYQIELALRGDRLEVRACSMFGDAKAEGNLPDPVIPNWMMENSSRPIAMPKLEKIGAELYHALFPGDVGRVWRRVLEMGQREGRPIHLELCFTADQIMLAEYPWELIAEASRGFLVHSGAIDLVRAVAFPRPQATLEVNRLLLPVLLVASRPCHLPSTHSLEIPGVKTHWLDEITFSEFQAIFSRGAASYSALQFYGSSGLVLECEQCGEVNSIRRTYCWKCDGTLEQAREAGALAFKGSEEQSDWIPVRIFGATVARGEFQYVLLLHCQASRMADHLVLGSVAVNLILAGTPMVISLQLPVSDDDNVNFFASSLQQGLRERGDYLSALREARIHLHTDWYSPTVYIRRWSPEADIETHRRLYLKRYYLLQQVVQSPEGELYLAYDLVLNQKRHIVTRRSRSEEVTARFRMQVQGLFSETNLPEFRMLDFFHMEGRCFVVVDHASDSQTLERLIHFVKQEK